MNSAFKIAVGTAAVVVVVAGIAFLPRSTSPVGGPVGEPTPTPTTSPHDAASEAPSNQPIEPVGDGPLEAGQHVAMPFAPPQGLCADLPLRECSETPRDDTIRITFTVPDGWESSFSGSAITKSATGTVAPSGMSLHLLRGGWLFSDPCVKVDTLPDIAVGPSVDDFVNALADHPLIDASTPRSVVLGGYSGQYIDIHVPSDISGCTAEYWPWYPGFYAQGPNHRWHVWSLDVDGIRVVIQSGDFARTLSEDLAEMHAIIASIQIEP